MLLVFMILHGLQCRLTAASAVLKAVVLMKGMIVFKWMGKLIDCL